MNTQTEYPKTLSFAEALIGVHKERTEHRKRSELELAMLEAARAKE